MLIECFTGFIPQGFEIFGQLLVLRKGDLVTLLDVRGRIDVNHAVVAIDYQFTVLQPGVGQIDSAHYRWNPHGPGQYGDMGISRASHRNDAD